MTSADKTSNLIIPTPTNSEVTPRGSENLGSTELDSADNAIQEFVTQATDASAASALGTQPDPLIAPAPLQLDFHWLKGSLPRFVAFGFGVGLIKPGPGTWGTLLAWGLWFPLSYLISDDILMAAFLGLAYIYGCYACHKVAQDMGQADHGGVVWDEIVAFCLVLFIIAPLGLIWQAIAFVLFRFFDIVKPWPISFFDEKLKNGFGVMWDDLIAALYSLFVLSILVRVWGE